MGQDSILDVGELREGIMREECRGYSLSTAEDIRQASQRLTLTWMGTISSSNLPASWAAVALSCDRRASES